MEEQYPNAYYCPISNEIMTDPVNAPDGRTYDRVSITTWLANNPVSPFTRAPMSVSELIPNYSLRTDIEAAKKAKTKADIPPKKEMKAKSTAEVKIEISSKENGSIIRIIPPVLAPRSPARLCCVLDISGSMDQEVARIDESGVRKLEGVSRIQLARAAIKTMITALEDDDEFALITFSNTAKTVIPLSKASEIRAKTLLDRVDKIEAEGQTNLWDGIRNGVLALAASPEPRNNIMLVLTDGEPNIDPPSGIVDSFKSLLRIFKEKHVTSCFCGLGSGKELDSCILSKLAYYGNGWFSIISSGQMLATIVINTICNALCQFTRNSVLRYRSGETEIGMVVPPLRYGQTLSFCHAGPVSFEGLDFLSTCTGKPIESTLGVFYDPTDADFQKFRTDIIQIFGKIGDYNETVFPRIVTRIAEFEKTSPDSCKLEEAKGLIKTLKGSVERALSDRDHYERWGVHYLRMLTTALDRQMSTDFKDDATKMYGGQVFRDLREACNATFAGIPLVKKDVVIQGATYNDHRGSCVSPSSLATMSDGSKKRAERLRKDDHVRSHDGVSTIVCVVKTIIPGGKKALVRLSDDLSLTSRHPVFLSSGEWSLPIQVGEKREEACDAIYNFVLDRDADIMFGNIGAASLGHAVNTTPDPYFGSKKVIEDLRQMSGWDDGLVTLVEH